MKDIFIERVWFPRDPANVKTSKKGDKPAFFFSMRYGSVLFICVTVFITKDGLYRMGVPGSYPFAGRIVYTVTMSEALKSEMMAQLAEKNPVGLSPMEFLAKFYVKPKEKELKDILERKSVAF